MLAARRNACAIYINTPLAISWWFAVSYAAIIIDDMISITAIAVCIAFGFFFIINRLKKRVARYCYPFRLMFTLQIRPQAL